MDNAQQRILELQTALATCLGALEVIELVPHGFNVEGLKKVKVIAQNALYPQPIFVPGAGDLLTTRRC